MRNRAGTAMRALGGSQVTRGQRERRPDLRIVFISRRNLLQTVVSDRVAKQTKLWNRWDADPAKPFERYYDSLYPLNAAEADHYLDPQVAKLGGQGTYGRLPNAAEIDAALAGDETGWLYPSVPVKGGWSAHSSFGPWAER